MLELLSFIVLSLVLPLLFFIPGFLLARAFTREEGDRFVLLALGASLSFFALAEFAAYLSPFPQWAVNAAAYLGVTGICLLRIRAARLPLLTLPGPTSLPPALFFLAYAAAISVQALIPVYSGAYWYGDWWLHYDVARFYASRLPLDTTWFGNVIAPTRTPFFNLYGAYFMSFLGTGFAGFQVASTLANVIFLFPVAALANRLAGQRAALIAVFLCIFSSALFTNELYTWPKLATAFCVLASVYFYLAFRASLASGGGKTDSRSLGLAVAFFLLGYMEHQTALYYGIGMLLDSLLVSLATGGASGIRRLAGAVIPALPAIIVSLAALAAPWYLWSFGIWGVEGTINASPSVAHAFTTISWFDDRVQSAEGTLYPQFFLEWYNRYVDGATGGLAEVLRCGPCMGVLYNGFIRYYFDTLPGALSFTLLASVVSLLAFRAFAWFRSGDEKVRVSVGGIAGSDAFLLSILVLSGFLIGHVMLAYMDTKGVLAHMLPVFILMLLPVSALLATLGERVFLAVACGYLSEFVLAKGSHLVLLVFSDPGGSYAMDVAMKAQNTLAFASDALGLWKWVFLPLSVALFAALFVLTTRSIAGTRTAASGSR